MRIQELRLAALSAAVVSCLPFGASAQLEEIIVTATRRETDLQTTPLSIQASPPSSSSSAASSAARTSASWCRTSSPTRKAAASASPCSTFAACLASASTSTASGNRRTAFSNRTSPRSSASRYCAARKARCSAATPTAAPSTSRRADPADEFGMRANFEIGEFNRRNATIAVDLPLVGHRKDEVDGVELRERRLLEEPHGASRVGQSRRSAAALRLALGADATASACASQPTMRTRKGRSRASSASRIEQRALHPVQRARRQSGLRKHPRLHRRELGPARRTSSRLNRTCQASLAASSGSGRRSSDTPDNGITRDLKYYTLTANWDIGENLQFESITSAWELLPPPVRRLRRLRVHHHDGRESRRATAISRKSFT